MISRIRGNLVKKEASSVILEVNGISYEINVPPTVSTALDKNCAACIELVIYHYYNMDKNRAMPVMIGFSDELEREFFEKFIGISGIGPKVALRAFDRPIPLIAKAIEEGDLNFLKSLDGIGVQKAKQIVAALQGKVGRFTLLKTEECKKAPEKTEIVDEARGILKRLQYNAKEIEEMIKGALCACSQVDRVEDLLNEIYKQRK
jgi:Holliday junction DNA helicase RuvA